MKQYYDEDINTLEVFFKKAENYGEEIEDGIIEFRAESNDEVIGYGFDDLSLVFKSNYLNAKQKLGVVLLSTRLKLGLTQEQMAKKLNIENLRQYQRYESGNYNTTLDKLEKLKSHLPEADFSTILKGSKIA